LPITFLACNAGVVGGGSGVIFSSHEEWMKMLGPNQFGPINCIRVFTPGMIAQDAPAAVELTASLAGVGPGGGLYGVSKHACMALGEALYADARGRLSVSQAPHLPATHTHSNSSGRVLRRLPPPALDCSAMRERQLDLSDWQHRPRS
jgi:NAD(P)-dependent dehydrogenase (short-subunit alcohol dehydrogenase family)